MLSITLSPSVVMSSSDSRSINWNRFARAGLVTTVAAALANVAVYYVGDAIVGYNPEFVELGSAFGIAVCTAIPAIIAVLLYAVLLRYTSDPARNLTVISAVVLVASLIPDYTFIPSEPGATTAQAVILGLMHVAAAGVIVRTLTTHARLRT